MSGGVLLYVDAKSVECNEADEPFSTASVRFEFRQGNAVAAIFEYHLHRHVDVDLIDGATDDVAAETWAVV